MPGTGVSQPRTNPNSDHRQTVEVRFCVRRVLWFRGFPLAPALRSIDSAGPGDPLFARFLTTMALR